MFLNLIFICWYIFSLFWFIKMFSNKRTIKRESFGDKFAYKSLLVIAFWLLYHDIYYDVHRIQTAELVILPHLFFIQAISLMLTVLGLVLAIWARVTLGKNWSVTVTFKENHELIVQGPYAFVRHPIYTGILFMFLGTALAVGTVGGLLSVPILFVSYWIKYRKEEAFMIEHFGEQYREYMRRVRAIIPFVF